MLHLNRWPDPSPIMLCFEGGLSRPNCVMGAAYRPLRLFSGSTILSISSSNIISKYPCFKIESGFLSASSFIVCRFWQSIWKWGNSYWSLQGQNTRTFPAARTMTSTTIISGFPPPSVLLASVLSVSERDVNLPRNNIILLQAITAALQIV